MLYNETVYSFGEPKSPLEAKAKVKVNPIFLISASVSA
jgi:hypothetical protein